MHDDLTHTKKLLAVDTIYWIVIRIGENKIQNTCQRAPFYYFCRNQNQYLMKKLFIGLLTIIPFFTQAQEKLTFKDGTTIDVISTDFSVNAIRKLNVGFVTGIDGLTDIRFFNINYLQPEKFYVGMHLGYASITAEGIIFISGKDIIKKRAVPLKALRTGYNTGKAYLAAVDLQKRKELGIYLAVSDFGTLFNLLEGEPGFDGDAYNNGFSKLTVVYAGIAQTGYWGHNIVMDKGRSQSHYLARTLLAPFYVVNGTKAPYADAENVPSYGLRFSYEITRSAKWINFGAKLGADGFMRKGKDPDGTFSNFSVAPIIAAGLGLSF